VYGICSDKKARKRQARLAKSRARRASAISRAAPTALNPYGSDESGADEAEGDGSSESDVVAGGAEEEELDDDAWAKAVQSGKISKGERLVPIDHSTIDYHSFRKVCIEGFCLAPNPEQIQPECADRMCCAKCSSY
jgi:hypothetical protein